MDLSKRYENLKSVIHQFDSVSLNEMNSVALMKRTDTKFIVNISYLTSILKELQKSYRVLEIKDKRIMDYMSLYLDTPEFKFYHDHHNGIVNRTKIRQRKYVDSNLTFLEIKQKNGKGETKKSRIKLKDFEADLSTSSKDFIFKITRQNFELKPSLWNRFNRITLVNLEDKERATIDLKLTYSSDNTEKSYENLVVIEVKQSKFDRTATIVKVLKKFNYLPYSISKYCIGVTHIYPNLKQNLFKNKLLKINKIIA
ncbi:polyphosphate polymerase domain-containing protein [Polaribacter glomeratus]|uniref:VTC domain-containing protein n=1 Tax=Polaribacter glomeratus TaxID=102 RepID=A0A2S7WFX3_9FLAO|nr:polyphosphate polymerase domain-containing protein [Polaribacter glomeratus]PQJ76306.1 hypothetical protein BTO16_10315 [Polaribacter glomeratus]TXD65439.1 polyphosphate polymerase domain-containing protein [Polaribacter glomeratus]